MSEDDIFIYHLDAELLKLYINPSSYDYRLVKKCFDTVLRIAFLLCKGKLLIPASNYFESDIAFDSISFFAPLMDYDIIHLLSTSGNLDLLLEKKAIEHGENLHLSSYHYKDYLNPQRDTYLPGTIHKRNRSASRDIKNGWLASIGNSKIWTPYFQSIEYSGKIGSFEKKLRKIPERLENRAFISDYVVPLLEVDSTRTRVTDRFLNVLITREYIKSFLLEYTSATALNDIPYLNCSELLPELEDRTYLSYSHYARALKAHRYRQLSAFDYIAQCSIMELLEYKQSTQWQDILLPPSTPKTFHLGGCSMDITEKTRIGIVTALPEEFATMCAVLDNLQEYSPRSSKQLSGERFFTGTITGSNETLHYIVLYLLPEYGNNMASIFTTKMLQFFPHIEHLIMVGIAGGVPSVEHIGDVVVSTEGVFQYDYGKNETERFIIRDRGTPCSMFLKEAVRYMAATGMLSSNRWHDRVKYISDKLSSTIAITKSEIESFYAKDQITGVYTRIERPGATLPSVHYGRIASANCVQKDPNKRDMLYEQEKVLAIEMEAAGIKDASRTSNTGYLVVRGICDFCDDEKDDVAHVYAAATASAYVAGLLSSMPAVSFE